MKTAVITGGTGATGLAIARALIQEGYAVGLIHRGDSAKAQEHAEALGAHCRAYQADISDAETTARAIDAVESELGPITVVVHAASERIARGDASEVTPAAFRQEFEPSVFGAFNLAHALLPKLRSREGALFVAITTDLIESGKTPSRIPGYISSKCALHAFLRSLAKDTQGSTLRVNALAPDLMDTPFSSDLPRKLFEWAAERDPRGRITTPDDVAEKLRYLLSPAGSQVSGMSLSVATDHVEPL
ncbi:MAG TPA: SDR family oxidoreductase [Candidatus Paceibacterota bacterium]|nr:SDR family oxidoreductase [Candidatus Paceibacterota bacterium]